MLERDDIGFFDTSSLGKTPGIEKRADSIFLERELEKRFPGEEFFDISVKRNSSGSYRGKASLLERMFGAGKKITGLPEYYEVELKHRTGEFFETLIVWSPSSWNDRFAGTAGGGTGIGGRNYITRPDNTQRGWTVPFALMNGFSAATMNAGNIDGWDDHTLDGNGKIRWELYDNWRVRSTHDMTVFGKAVAEILHDRSVRYSYFSGGSGGGRQALVEVQNYPEDYDGVWASCPAINWHKFIFGGFWPLVVMNEHRYFLTAEKNRFFLDEIHRVNGGEKAYYSLEEVPPFDALSLVGRKVGRGKITEKDALVSNEILAGPHRKNGERLWYGFRPGCQNWQKVIPIGTYYYPLFGKRIEPFILGPLYLRWITEDRKTGYKDMTYDAFLEYFDRGMEKFSSSLADSADIDDFVRHGGKLIIDHGTDDPLIPVDGTLDYYRKLRSHFKSSLDDFFRLYITPGDNHGNCRGNGAGLTEKDGMKALIGWVEEGRAPGELRKVRVDRKTGETIEEGTQRPFGKEAENE